MKNVEDNLILIGMGSRVYAKMPLKVFTYSVVKPSEDREKKSYAAIAPIFSS